LKIRSSCREDSSFSEEKEAKRLCESGARRLAGARSFDKSFLLLFYKKEVLTFTLSRRLGSGKAQSG
jgi:hypothetical protein